MKRLWRRFHAEVVEPTVLVAVWFFLKFWPVMLILGLAYVLGLGQKGE